MNLLGENNIIIGPEVARRVLEQCEQEKIAISEKLMEVLTAVQSDGVFRAMSLVSLTKKEIDIIKKEIKKIKPSLHKKPGEVLSFSSFTQYILGGFVYYKDKETLDPDLTMTNQPVDPITQNLTATLKKSLSGFLPYRAGIREYVAEHCLQKDGCVQFDSKQQFENRLQDIFGGELPESLQKQLVQVRQDADTIIMSSAYRCIPTPAEDKQLCTIQWDIEATCLLDYKTQHIEFTYDFQTMQQGHECLRRMLPDTGFRDTLLDKKIDVVGNITKETVEAFSQYDRFLTKIKKEHPGLRALLLARRDVQDEVNRQDIFQRIQANEVWKTMIEKHDQSDLQDKIRYLLSGTAGETFVFAYYQSRLGHDEKGNVAWFYPSTNEKDLVFYVFWLQDILSICTGPIWTIPVDKSIEMNNLGCYPVITRMDDRCFRLRIHLSDDEKTYFECIITSKEIAQIVQLIHKYMGNTPLIAKITYND